MGCCWSDPIPDSSSAPQPVFAQSPPRTTASGNYLQRVCYNYREESSEKQEVNTVGDVHVYYQSHSNEAGQRDGYGSEEDFFRSFFSVLDRVPGYHGTLQRWKNDVKWAAEEKDSHILRWDYIWRQDDIGYLKTLKWVSQLVEQEEWFTTADLVNLLALAKSVAKHRKREYYRAESNGKANRSHLKAMRGWMEIVDSLETMTS